MLHATQPRDRPMLWANLHLLFWLSLFPFVTGWMGENHFASAADRALRRRAADGGDRLLDPAADDHQHEGAGLAAGARDRPGLKGKLSPVALRAGDRAAIREPLASRRCIYVVVALMWLVPDRRIEHALSKAGDL